MQATSKKHPKHSTLLPSNNPNHRASNDSAAWLSTSREKSSSPPQPLRKRWPRIHPIAKPCKCKGSALPLGKPADAVPLLEKAHLSIPRTNIDSNYVLGLCYLDTRRYDDARKAFATQYNFPPDSPSAYLLAARMMLRRDYLPVADTFAQKALALNPNLPMAHLLIGQIRLSQSKLPEAIAEFNRESELNPLYGEVYDRLGDAYLRQGDYASSQAVSRPRPAARTQFLSALYLVG